MITLRASAIAVALAVTVTTLTIVSMPGETKETSIAETCAHVTWPSIPAYCLIGASDRRFREVSADRAPASEMAVRFTTAFQ